MTHNVSGREHRRLFIPFIALFIILSLLMTACGEDNAQSSGAKLGGDLGVGLNADVVTLDPLKSTALVDRQVMLNMYDTLVQVNAQNEIVPDLATSWSYTSPTQLVFTLRTDVKFQDGTPLNADAVVFNIERILSTQSSPRYSELSSVEKVEAQDTSHVLFHLKQPFSPLLATLSDRAGMILSPAAVKSLGDNLGNAPAKAGSGAFAFGEWIKGDHLTIKKNTGYWLKDSQGQALPYLNSIRYRPITNGSLRYSNLQTGTINATDTLDPNDVPSAKSNPDLVYKQAAALSFFGFMLNTKMAPFNNPAARRAVEWGVNRQEILDSVLKGNGVLASGPIPPTSWAYDKNFKPYTYDVNKAKAELAQIGGSLTFTMLVPSGSPLNTQEAQFIQSELQAAGITMNIKQETFATVLSDTDAHNFQAALIGWSGRPDPDGNLYSYFHTGGGNNNMQYSSPQVDTLLEKARTSNDQKERATAYQQAQQQILQDASYVFINHGVSIQATTASVKDFAILPTGIMMFTSVYLSQ
ncbi:ABC transporter substrate-binding protein [Ktedonospora formicarum]|uniref:Peptide ABC transporter substrate-binding protein n=1 Tax=Ktedonospora formicarum TaxID=2778364 RepID=A0A8J3IBR4_9CHLR|nr:ABC transporter substrate-binding protein [Ktedonospora formicarum]GHO51061.1 peptide ABC transporter substrate-binding protein [Ktedonospora formicarum]